MRFKLTEQDIRDWEKSKFDNDDHLIQYVIETQFPEPVQVEVYEQGIVIFPNEFDDGINFSLPKEVEKFMWVTSRGEKPYPFSFELNLDKGGR